MVAQQSTRAGNSKPKTKKGRLALKAREPQEEEVLKTALLIYGPRTTQVLKDVLSDFAKFKWNECKRYTQLHPDLQPFEAGSELTLQNYCKKLDTGLFVVASTTKKRPNNLVFGRVFDAQILDMLELGVSEYIPMQKFKHPGGIVGAKPMFVFVGEKFNTVPELQALKSLFLDFFRGRVVSSVLSKGLDRVILVVALGDKKILFRHYKSSPKKQGEDSIEGNISLKENGPRVMFEVRRFRAAPPDLESEAMKQKEAKKKEKNVKGDMLDGKIGRVYMPRQDVDSIVLAKPKGVKRGRTDSAGTPQKKSKG